MERKDQKEKIDPSYAAGGLGDPGQDQSSGIRIDIERIYIYLGRETWDKHQLLDQVNEQAKQIRGLEGQIEHLKSERELLTRGAKIKEPGPGGPGPIEPGEKAPGPPDAE